MPSALHRTFGGWRTAGMVLVLVCCLDARDASAQLGALVSPGPLARAHASLEGVTKCLQCHARGRQVAADKCLSCHAPVAERIARRTGVHRNVTTDCVSCHVEHAGEDAELRPFDHRSFDHAAETNFPLDGLHAPLTGRCEACHKTRSFLTVRSACASCHADAHKGALGPKCETCHTTSVRFAETRTRFDHSRTAFPLTGAHEKVACASCHRTATYRGVPFASCGNCHTDPHAKRFPQACASCHTTETWRTTRFDHTRTTFPLRGRHAAVECRSCHVQPAARVKPKADTCAACHTDPHRGAFKQDCRACHNETTFRKGTFDHATTRFPLKDRHAAVECAACHKGAARSGPQRAAARAAVDFRGLRTACDSCHADVHRGELGLACERCHSARTFAVTVFSHARQRPFFEGAHTAVRCEQCHAPPGPAAVKGAPVVRVGFTTTSTACASCHRDVHLGQVGASCEACHAVHAPKFAVVGFSHDASAFPLTGKHAAAACALCHKVQTAVFPGGKGTARQLTGVATACASCHQDTHAGQLGASCQACHTTQTFAVTTYTHRNARALRDFFTGRHELARCRDCHVPAAPRGGGTAVPSYRISTACERCHDDVHRGSLGTNCGMCHRPDELVLASAHLDIVARRVW